MNNHFRDYTIVHVLYCSGDIFGGNVVRDYTDKDGVPIIQKGIHIMLYHSHVIISLKGFTNAQVTLDWVIQQQKIGNLASTLTSVVTMGCSAGSIGAQLWGNQIVTNLKWNQAAVIPDSYAGVFPEGSQGPLIYDFVRAIVILYFNFSLRIYI